MIPIIKMYKLAEDAIIPAFATTNSACFDLCAYLPISSSVTMYTIHNVSYKINTPPNTTYIDIRPGERALIPTGLILDIPEGYSVRLHIRSSMALKHGISLANATGVIDSDYVDPLYIMVHNISNSIVYINNGDRIAQGELVPQLRYTMSTVQEKPGIKGNRTGGFGSTG